MKYIFFNAFIFNLLFFSSVKTLKIEDNNYKLELLQVFFRHGDRVPEKEEVYRSDPNQLSAYGYIGYGELTEAGINRMQKLGRALRERYDNFLGEYQPYEVYGYSTNFNRTKISLQALLAGLYAPSSEQHDNYLGQLSIITHYDKLKDNFLNQYFSHETCPRYFEEITKLAKSPKTMSKLKKYSSTIYDVEKFTGLNIEKLNDFVHFHSNLKSMISMKLPRPEWLTDKLINNVDEMMKIFLNVWVGSLTLKRIAAGPMIEKIIKNVQDNEDGVDGGKKIYLYGGHDININALIKAHSFSNVPGYAEFGSAVIIEKLKKNDMVYIRMFYWTGVTEKLIPLYFGNSNEISFELYLGKVHTLIPNPNDCFLTGSGYI